MTWNLMFFFNSILLGVGLAMDAFSVSIIPHTAGNTILGEKRVGDVVNLENDIIGKYVEKLLQGGVQSSWQQADFQSKANGNQKQEKSGITMEFLAANGF